MAFEILTSAETLACDQIAIAKGPLDGYHLMRRAGFSVAGVVLARFPEARCVDVLCGPGNNGGDGYVAASQLSRAGVTVHVWAESPPRSGSDAARCADEYFGTVRPLADFRAGRNVVVDALYGTGLSKPLAGPAAQALATCELARSTVVAVDLPSGVSGDSGQIVGPAFTAAVTVTFVRRKPGHLLLPGRDRCGIVLVADIGIPDQIVQALDVRCFENQPAVWLRALPSPGTDTHKYERGHAVVFSGGASNTGAARLSAMAAARAGAGAITLMSPTDALAENAAHLTSIMLKHIPATADLAQSLMQLRVAAVIIGPGYGVTNETRAFILTLIAALGESDRSALCGLVLDADAITAFRDAPESLYEAVSNNERVSVVLTPHEGEFARLFPDLGRAENMSKLEKARQAAARSHSVIVYKGSDTVIAAPDGRAAINTNGTPLLATAGSGDVLAGIIGGLLAQRMPAFEACCAAVWMHADAANRFGPGLIAEDLPGILPSILKCLVKRTP